MGEPFQTSIMNKKIGLLSLGAGRNAGGPEVYEHNIVRSLAAVDSDTEFHVYCTSSAAIESFGLEQDNVIFHQMKPSSRLISLPFVFPRLLKKHGIDFYHAMYAPAPVSSKPFLFSHHCFSNFAHPEFYPWSIRMRLEPLIKRGLRDSDVVLCVSDDVRQRTAEHFNMDLSRFRVIHHGVNPVFAPQSREEARERVAQLLGIQDPYVLVVGKLETRKNLQRTLEAFAEFRKKVDEPVKLVLAGKRTWHNKVLDEALSRLDLTDHVVETGYIPHDKLNSVYSGALMYVFASLWEGFGMPVLEAMRCGTPVITSNISSLPEVAGDAALLVDPYSVSEIVEAMVKLYGDDALREEMRERGFKQSSLFSWEKAAAETLSAYREML